MLHNAAYYGHNNVISYLLGIGADPNNQKEVNIYKIMLYIKVWTSGHIYIKMQYTSSKLICTDISYSHVTYSQSNILILIR